MANKIRLSIVYNVGHNFKEIVINYPKTSTLESLYKSVIKHFKNDDNDNIAIKIGMLFNAIASLNVLLLQ